MKEINLRQLVPHNILENLRLGKLAGGFEAAGLFVDTTGFSVMTDTLMEHGQHGAEVLAGVMRATFQPLMQAVFEAGGFVFAQEGDSFSALFPEEHDAAPGTQRALAAAWKMQQLAAEQAVQHTPYGEFKITVKVGLACGPVEWGIIKSADGMRAAYFFRGSAVDHSAEAEHHARAGEIWMSAPFFEQVRGQVLAEVETNAAGFFRLLQITGPLPPARPFSPTGVDAARASIFLPQELFSQTYQGEFRLVASLFVNLPTLRDTRQLHLFMQSVFELQDMYGGILKLFFGDKGAHLLLFWGAPVSKENDLERALNFILELQARTTIPIKGGITYQIAHTGFVGSTLAEDFCAFGRGTNLAARFMTQAPRGEIWVDKNCVRREERRFFFEEYGEVTFKGFAMPQKVYRLIDRKEETEIFFRGKLVGREQELSQLKNHVRPILRGGYAGPLVVWGEPGQGKSRLVHEFLRLQEQAAPDAFQTFLCQCDEILREPLNPFRYWLLRYFQVSDGQGELRSKRSFNRKLDALIAATQDPRLASELDRTRSLLGAIVGLYWADSLYEQLDAKGRYENTWMALAALLRAESLRQPVILFIEDMHWLDEESKAFFPYLLRALQDQEPAPHPVAILGTARFEGAGLPLEGFPYAELHLSALSQDTLAALAESILQGPVSNSMIDILKEQADGNPFFTEQILLYLKENRLLERRYDGWSTRANRPLTLPTDVNVLLIARLDRLVGEVKEVVQRAAVLGREFEVQLLLSMLNETDRSGLNRRINQAEAESIWTSLSSARYIFKHALMRDAAYHMQLRARQQSLHALALAAYEQIYASDLKSHAVELAYHAENAGSIEKARRYMVMESAAFQEMYQNNKALETLTRALALAETADLEEQFQIRLAREQVYSVMGSTAERQRDLEALVAMLPALNDGEKSILVRIRQADFALDTGAYSEAVAYAQEAEALAQSASQKMLAVRTYRLLGIACFRLGDLNRAVCYTEKGLALARALGERQKESQLLNSLGVILIEQGKLEEAQTAFLRSLEIAQKTGSLRDKAQPLNSLGMIAGSQGRYTDALAFYEQSLALSQKTGDKAGECLILGNLGFISGVLGDYPKARAYLEQNLHLAGDTWDLQAETYSLINLSACTGAMGEYENAVRFAEGGLAHARRTGDRSAEAWSLTYLGHALLALRNIADAEAAYQGALDIRQALDQPVLAAEPAAGLARAAIESGDFNAARQHLAPVLRLLEQGSSLDGTDEPLRVYLTCYLALEKTEPERARTVLQTAHSLLMDRAEHIPDKTARESFLKNIAHHREIRAAWAKTADTAGR